jgi:heme A synthase
MKPAHLLKFAAGCQLFFAVGHSAGHFTRKSVDAPRARQVFALMEDYKFPIGTKLRSYDEFYTGMSLNLVICLLTFTALLWIAAGLAQSHPRVCTRLLVPVLLGVTAFSATGFGYFFPVPAVTCLVAAVLISLSLFSLRKVSTSSVSQENSVDNSPSPVLY